MLDEIYGAQVQLVDTDDYQDIDLEMDRTARELEAQGRRCCIIPVGGSTPLGTLGYVSAARECAVQAMAAGIRVGHLVSAAGSGGTTAGLLLGAGRFLHGAKVTGMEVSPGSLRETVLDLAAQAAGLLEVPFQPKEDDLRLRSCAGPGYAIPDPAATPAILELARTEGILLDPVYTGKAWAGLLAELEAGGFDGEDDIVFVHTGGAGALFALDLPEAST